MIIDDGDTKVRTGEGKTSPRKETQRPPQYDVIVHQKNTNGKVNPCVACVLTEVFNMHDMVAIAHAANVCVNGKETVYTSTREAAETKADDANAEKKKRGIICGFKLRNVNFTAEPSP